MEAWLLVFALFDPLSVCQVYKTWAKYLPVLVAACVLLNYHSFALLNKISKYAKSFCCVHVCSKHERLQAPRRGDFVGFARCGSQVAY